MKEMMMMKTRGVDSFGGSCRSSSSSSSSFSRLFLLFIDCGSLVFYKSPPSPPPLPGCLAFLYSWLVLSREAKD